MSSGDLIPNDHDHVEHVANEVHFALVIARIRACPENPGPSSPLKATPSIPSNASSGSSLLTAPFYTDCMMPVTTSRTATGNLSEKHELVF
jgi:hypothetical protein